MWLRGFLVLVLLLLPVPAHAAEALGLKVLGFSPDGRLFGFVQFGGVGDGGDYIVEAFVIDVERDRWVAGTPLVFESWKANPPIDEDRPYEEWLGAFAEKRFAKELKKYDLRPASGPAAADEGALAGQTFALSSDKVLSLGATSIEFRHKALGQVRLTLDEKRMPWPRTSLANSVPGGLPCSREVDWEDGVAFRLTLHRAGNAVVLNDDRTIPPSRNCVLGYGISEVHAFDRPDGKVSLAVVIGMSVRGFEGNDRRFLAVTRVLAP